MVELLLARGASASAANDAGDQPFHAAAFVGDVRTLRMLRGQGARADAVGANGEQALTIAARSGHVDAVRFLLERGGATIAAVDAAGRTALDFAALAGQASVCECLLFYRAAPTADTAAALQAASRTLKTQAASDATRRSELARTLSPQWAARVALMPPTVCRLLALNEDPNLVCPLHNLPLAGWPAPPSPSSPHLPLAAWPAPRPSSSTLKTSLSAPCYHLACYGRCQRMGCSLNTGGPSTA